VEFEVQKYLPSFPYWSSEFPTVVNTEDETRRTGMVRFIGNLWKWEYTEGVVYLRNGYRILFSGLRE